jgi:hypothetical protein
MLQAKYASTSDEADATSVRLRLMADNDVISCGKDVNDGGNSACVDSFSAEQSTPTRDRTAATVSGSSTIRFWEDVGRFGSGHSTAVAWVNSVNGMADRAGSSVNGAVYAAASTGTLLSDEVSLHGRLRLGANAGGSIGGNSQSKKKSTAASFTDDDDRHVTQSVHNMMHSFRVEQVHQAICLYRMKL